MDNDNRLFDQPKSVGAEDGINYDATQKASANTYDNRIREKELERQERKDQRGWVGKFWGEGDHAAKNIAGLLICAMLILGGCYTYGVFNCFNQSSNQLIADFWKIITPLITLALGYLFGKSVK